MDTRATRITTAEHAYRHLPAEALRAAIRSAPTPQLPHGPSLREAAVFLLIYDHTEPTILAVLKSDRHGYPWRNQVAFPGGIGEPDDIGPVDTAFRELNEELGIRTDQVDFLGMLGQFQTIAETVINAAAGVWTGRDTIVPDPHEISRVLHMPVFDLLATHEASGFTGYIPGINRLRYPVDDLEVWGATARIIHQFLEITADVWRQWR